MAKGGLWCPAIVVPRNAFPNCCSRFPCAHAGHPLARPAAGSPPVSPCPRLGVGLVAPLPPCWSMGRPFRGPLSPSLACFPPVGALVVPTGAHSPRHVSLLELPAGGRAWARPGRVLAPQHQRRLRLVRGPGLHPGRRSPWPTVGSGAGGGAVGGRLMADGVGGGGRRLALVAGACLFFCGCSPLCLLPLGFRWRGIAPPRVRSCHLPPGPGRAAPGLGGRWSAMERR